MYVNRIEFFFLRVLTEWKTSLDNIKPALNEAYSKAFFTFFESKLGTQTDRGYMYVQLRIASFANTLTSRCSTFFDPGRANMGYGTLFMYWTAVLTSHDRHNSYQGTTFTTLFGK